MKNVVILINEISEQANADELDVLDQAKVFEAELELLGYKTYRVFLGLDFRGAHDEIRKHQPEFVVNLVESFEKSGRLIYFAPAWLEQAGFCFTGNNSEAMYITSNKMLAKRLMKQAGILTAPWICSTNVDALNPAKQYIAKPVWEDASVGITDENVMVGDAKKARRFLEKNANRPYFFEEFISGREFNISVLGGNEGPEVLPIAEMMYYKYPEGKPKIMGYEAKWAKNTFEYDNTSREFLAPEQEPGLALRLRQICTNCWKLFGLKGYVRVDFRVDESGDPFVLEINANPCLSPDAGFYVASQKAGYSASEMLKRIFEDVWK
ncbi:MAG: ATP-grasp domain-containing protein [Bacteroidetes bacterium]|nr:ATP-grasp domain-containing protein [Bacteroidota bacterium]MBU1717824.1 ATP-grasp domain-containing protein [Bacteroidota bacterium]